MSYTTITFAVDLIRREAFYAHPMNYGLRTARFAAAKKAVVVPFQRFYISETSWPEFV